MTRHKKMPETDNGTDTARTRDKKVRLNERFVKSLLPPKVRQKITYDAELKGFGVRVTDKGNKSFVLNYRIKGRERRITIGEYPSWTVLAARKVGQDYRRQIADGKDPLEKRETERAAPTMRDLWAKYERDYLTKLAPKSRYDAAAMFQKTILPKIGAKKVADVTFADCDNLHRSVSAKSPIQANRMHSVLRRTFHLAITWGWIERNPAVGIQRNPENKRERYLTKDEISRLLVALDAHPEKTSCAALRFMLLTGCRRGEALKARWDQFDSEMRIWTKPAATTKQRKLHRVPVSRAVTQILLDQKTRSESDYVFSGRTGGALTDVKRTWEGVSRYAGLEGVRINDLRHTFASIAVSQGQSLPIIGAMLGHTQTQTTARYAHLFDDPLSHAAEVVSATIAESR